MMIFEGGALLPVLAFKSVHFKSKLYRHEVSKTTQLSEMCQKYSVN